MKMHGRHGVGVAVAIITLAALLLRVVAARGGLWLDEAWSAIFAQEAVTPAGVLFNINHDNNHHLNTLWLQLVGRDASPILQRALSIVTSTATVPVAARIAGRRGAAAAIVAAITFAIAPFLFTYGTEARGYAPMLFAWVCAIGMADRWLADPEMPLPAIGLAIAALLGCLAQATMVFGLAILTLWVVVERTRRAGIKRSLIDTTRLFAPAAIVAIALVALGWAAASASGTGFQFGNREPHDWGKWLDAVDQLLAWTFGASIMVVPIAWLTQRIRDRFLTLVPIAVALPVAVALLGLPNSGASRYYAVVVPPLLLWAAIFLPIGWASRRGRWMAGVVALVFLVSAAWRDGALIADQRGDPGRAITAMARRQPGGTTVSFDFSRSSAIVIVAGWSQHYPLTAVATDCPPAPFHFVERDGDAAFPSPLIRCGQTYRTIAHGDPAGLSGTHWRLYARTR